MVDVIPTKGTRTDTGGTGHRPKKAGVGKSTVQAAQRREKKRKTNRDSARRMRALRKKELENLKEKEKTLDDENEALRKKLIAASQLVERLATEVQDLAAVPLHEKSSREKVVSRTVEEFQVLLHPWKQGTPGPTRANSVVEDKGPARTTEAYFNVPDLASKSSGDNHSSTFPGNPQMAMSMEFYNAIINPSGVCIEMRPCNSSSTAYGNPALVSLPQPGLQSSVHATDHAQQHQAVQRSVEDHPETFFSTLMNVDTAELPSYLDWL